MATGPFFSIYKLDVAALTAYIIYCKHNKTGDVKRSRRRLLLTEMGEELCYPLIEERAAKSLSMFHLSTQNAVECLMGISINKIISQNETVEL